ncbi:MAG TPA: TrkA family potassium uptake protein [Candidatus Omnitrophota bacterium]|nr:TrkA family potassium uptake protein [Candidatus Omnitrophota bacterium]HPB67690.1 TrkA family potassium uptake protein [Candidatus Omnitrophota bacterium]HQO57403.1 TrkA family potassium uptake protein [Candidatus Omnitrophota bacterium]
MKNILIIGLGHFGCALVEELSKNFVEIIAIEEDQAKADLVKDKVEQVIVANAANRELLLKFSKNIDCAIVCISEKIDSSVLVTYHLKEIGIKKIIAKATTIAHGEILMSIGASEIIYPEEETAKRIARNLVSPDILDAIRLSDDFDIIESPVPEKFLMKSIRDLQLRNKYGIDILAVKNPLTGQTKIMPPSDYQFRPDDVLIFIGEAGSVNKLNKL